MEIKYYVLKFLISSEKLIFKVAIGNSGIYLYSSNNGFTLSLPVSLLEA